MHLRMWNDGKCMYIGDNAYGECFYDGGSGCDLCEGFMKEMYLEGEGWYCYSDG